MNLASSEVMGIAALHPSYKVRAIRAFRAGSIRTLLSLLTNAPFRRGQT